MKYLVIIFFMFNAQAKLYQVGDSWDKKHIISASQRSQQLKESIGEIRSKATLFYIGQIKNKFIAITNYHVCPITALSPYRNENKCTGANTSFPYYKNKKGESLIGKVRKVLITNKDLDLAVLAIDFQNLESFNRPPTPLVLSSKKPYITQSLISIGFGVYQNEYAVMMIEENSDDCQVFSKDFRFASDPDTSNPTPYKVISFLHGCDVSHGDSGSPLFDSETLEVIGMVWTGKYPKNNRISQADFHTLPLEFLWQQLNYAVAASLIKEEILKKL